jgi:cardiolipin synthase A/B
MRYAEGMRSRLFALVLATFALAAPCTSGCAAEVAAEVDEELIASDPKLLGLCKDSQHYLYAAIRGKAVPKDWSDALVAAMGRGVDVRVILVRDGYNGGYWQAQQRLEGYGVPVDVVRTDSTAKVTLVSERGSFEGGQVITTATVLTERKGDFERAFPALVQPSANPALQRAEAVAVLPMPESGTQRIVDVIAASRSSIDLSIYQLQDRSVIAALKAAKARGVVVRIMLEPKTVGARNFDPVAAELTAVGIVVQPTPPRFDASRNVDHAKFFVLDGKELLFSTGNLGKSSVGSVTEPHYRLRDFWVEDTRMVNVAAAGALFSADFQREATPQGALAPFVLTPENAETKIGSLIDGARRRLWVYNQTLDDAGMQARIIAAKRRGVDVQVLAGYQPGFAGPPPNDASVKELQAAGIPTAYLKRHYLHAKAIVADNSVYLGSQNFSNGGLRNNREFGEVLSDAAAVRKVADTFAADFAAHE